MSYFQSCLKVGKFSLICLAQNIERKFFQYNQKQHTHFLFKTEQNIIELIIFRRISLYICQLFHLTECFMQSVIPRIQMGVEIFEKSQKKGVQDFFKKNRSPYKDWSKQCSSLIIIYRFCGSNALHSTVLTMFIFLLNRFDNFRCCYFASDSTLMSLIKRCFVVF